MGTGSLFPIIIGMYHAVQRAAVIKSTPFLGMNLNTTPMQGIREGQYMYILLFIIIYGFDTGDITIAYLVQFINFILFGLLLWRVETLPQLENTSMEQRTRQTLVIPSNIEQLLAEHCVSTQLYLQHDLTITQLAQAVGTNRLYLSHYFSRQGMTYNAYINDLRIDHFMSLYREATSARQPITAQQLASDSGYRSYSTFSLAFKQRLGKSVTSWMREMAQ